MQNSNLGLRGPSDPITRWARQAKPSLRMADGGFFSGLLDSANRLVGNNDEAQRLRGRTVEQVMAPPAPAPAPAPAPGYNSGVPTATNPAGIRFADGGAYRKGSLRGGRVHGPGDGTVDTVDAKYANGEYVLPTDTARAIGYDKLDAIKDATHTPVAEQRGYSLRGNPLGDSHAGNYTDRRALAETVSGRFLAKPALVEPDAATENLPAVRRGLRPDSNGLPPVQSRPLTLRLSDGSPSGMGGAESPWAHAERVNPTGPANNFQSTGFADHFAPESAKPAGPSMKNPMNWGEGIRGATRATAQAAGGAAKVASGAIASGTTAVAKGVASHGMALGNIVGATAAHGNAYFDGQVPFMDKLRIGATDATAVAGGAVGGIVGGTLGAMTGPAAVVAAPAGVIGGSAVGEVGGRWLGNKIFGGSDAQTRNGYDPERNIIDVAKDTLRNGVSDDVFGRAKTPNVNPADQRLAAGAQQSPGATSASPTNPAAYNTPGADATMPGQDPGRPAPPPTLRGQAGADVYGAPGVNKFTQGGKTLYSNVTGPDNDKLMSGGAGVSTVPGMSRAEIDQTLGGKSAGQTTADNAIRAANLRDGVDMERGISNSSGGGGTGGLAAQYQNILATSTNPSLRASAMQSLQSLHANEGLLAQGARSDATLRRGQDMIMEEKKIPYAVAEMQRRAVKESLRTGGGDNLSAARSLEGAGFTDLAKHFRDAETSDQARGNAQATARDKEEKDFTDQVLQAHTTTVDGKPVIDQNGANQTMSGVKTMIAQQIQDLTRSGTPADLVRAKRLQDHNIQALDPATRQKAIAAVKLMNKVGADGSNMNPFAPDHMGTSNPADFMNLKRNSSGDYVTRNGKVIPARYLAKQNADRFGGVPVNEFDILKGQ